MNKDYDKTFSKFCDENSCKDCKYESSMGMTCEEMWQLERDAEIRADERARVFEALYNDVLCLENEYWSMLAHTRVKSLEWFDLNGKLVATTKIKYLIQDKSKGADE